MKILFVCTGNTCRSCMAEAIFNNINKSNDFQAFSAGISVYNGSRTSINSAVIVKKILNVDISERKAVQIDEKILQESDIILTMTGKIRERLIDCFSEYSSKIYSLNKYIGAADEVLDPFGCDISIYKNTFNQLYDMIGKLLNKLKEEKGIL